MSETLLWTFQETARQLGVSVRTVQRLVKAGGLPQVTMGRLCRIPASAVKNWVEKNTQTLHNFDRVRQAVRDQQEIRTCLSEKNIETKTEYFHDQTRPTGGQAGQMQAASRLAEVLAFDAKMIRERKGQKQ